jgi:hypothetical protein
MNFLDKLFQVKQQIYPLIRDILFECFIELNLGCSLNDQGVVRPVSQSQSIPTSSPSH